MKNIDNYIVSEDTSIIETLKVINDGDNSIAFLCRNGYLLGTVTDGDIRRFIISGGDLQAPVGQMANTHPISVQLDEEADYTAIMKKYSVSALPILKDGYLCDIVFLKPKSWKKTPINTQVVIMAGGKGSRLKPYTDIIPKPLIPIGDMTITEHIMERFADYGCNHFDIVVNYKKDFIKSYFTDNEKTYDIDFIEEKDFLGTAGGLSLLKGKYKDSFFLTNCDILLDGDYYEMYKYHKTFNNIITVILASKKIVIPYGTYKIDTNGIVKDIVEKPEINVNVSTGVYIMKPDFLEYIPENTRIDLPSVIEICMKKGEKVGAYIIDEDQWLDMGQLSELEKMKERLRIQ